MIAFRLYPLSKHVVSMMSLQLCIYTKRFNTTFGEWRSDLLVSQDPIIRVRYLQKNTFGLQQKSIEKSTRRHRRHSCTFPYLGETPSPSSRAALSSWTTQSYTFDAAILWTDSTHPLYGFMKFSGYTKHISPEARSVGILTQPFDQTSQTRDLDAGSLVRDRCRIVVTSFVDYIQKRFPRAAARVRIHNNPNETIALTYARIWSWPTKQLSGCPRLASFPRLPRSVGATCYDPCSNLPTSS